MEPKGFLNRILEGALILALSSWLIRTAVKYLEEVWTTLLLIFIIAFVCTLLWRIYRHWRDTGQW